MPEIVTKYPEILLNELKNAGGKCGEGLPAKILTACPKDRFCVLPTGEICVFDLKEISTMTQISHNEWLTVTENMPSIISPTNLIIIIFMLGMGLLLGMTLSKNKK